MPIEILAPEVASQIAAGEVIERPASVVKELLENSLDAGALQIDVSVEGAGKRLIQVIDNGQGIPAQELTIAIARHATSKLKYAEELFHLHTLGFRGEALASIGSVARMTIVSRHSGAQAAMRLVVDAGQAGSPEPVGAPVGTLVQVEDLFYNLPARLKFLKSDQTERRQIDNLVTRYALAYPQVRFNLHQDNKAVLQTSGNGDRREVLAALYGVETARKMLEVLSHDLKISITGYTSPPAINRANRREILFFINGRPVQDVSLTTALIQAYRTMLMVGRYPLACIFLDIDPEEVDVNVHPAKAEVRFRNQSAVFATVQSAIRRALLAHSPIPDVGEALTWSQSAWRVPEFGDQAASDAGDISSPPVEEAPPLLVQTSQPDMVPILRLIGQVAATFLVAEGPDGLYLIDQHAAHERVLFEKLMQQRKNSETGAGFPAQRLLEPVTVHMPVTKATLLEDQLPVLNRFGFSVEEFGSSMFLVRSIPALLSNLDPEAALWVVVEEFEEDETPLKAEVETRIIARVCKRAAVKAGQILSTEEQRALLKDLEACHSPRTCPHGRPTMIHLSVDLLERQFGRKGPR